MLVRTAPTGRPHILVYAHLMGHTFRSWFGNPPSADLGHEPTPAHAQATALGSALLPTRFPTPHATRNRPPEE